MKTGLGSIFAGLMGPIRGGCCLWSRQHLALLLLCTSPTLWSAL